MRNQTPLVPAAIILLSSATISFAGNFTPIPKNKIVQTGCGGMCQNNFAVCVQLNVPPPVPPPIAGTQQVTPTAPLPIGPDCAANLKVCLLLCQGQPRG